MNLSEIKENPDNPRFIKNEKFEKLVESLRQFPKMMELRPIVVDDDMMALGGNMRRRALEALGYVDIPDSWVKKAEDLTQEERDRFIITDNIGYGEWDMDILANQWEIEDLNEWGLDIPNLDEFKATKDIPDEGEIMFSENLLLEHNYVVLYFDNPMDWEVAMARFGLKKVKTNTPEKSQKIGIGRVINGSKFI